MTQQQVIKFLRRKANKGKEFSAREIGKSVNKSPQSISVNLRSLKKQNMVSIRQGKIKGKQNLCFYYKLNEQSQ